MFKKYFSKRSIACGFVAGTIGATYYNVEKSVQTLIDNRYSTYDDYKNSLIYKYLHRYVNYRKHKHDIKVINYVKQNKSLSDDSKMYKLCRRLLTGKEFNEIFPDAPKIKYLRHNFKHFNMDYVNYVDNNLVVNIEPMLPLGECLPGGMYFYNNHQPSREYRYLGIYMVDVSIPDDAYVYIMEENKCKTDKFYIKNKRNNPFNWSG
jgi:hypothetical protein